MATTFNDAIASGLIEPITLAEAKAHLRIDNTNDDDLITIFIKAAREMAEAITWRKLNSGTVVDTFSGFPLDGVLRLKNPPLQSVTSVKYYDENNIQQTLSSSYYEVDTQVEPGRIRRAYGYSWPTTYDRLDAVEVTYVAGYSAPYNVPASIKSALFLMIGHLYENRETVVVGDRVSVNELPMATHALLDLYSVRNYYEL